MFRSNLKRSVMTLAVVTGLLAVAGPASAQVLPGMVGFTTPATGPGPQVAGWVIIPDPELRLLKVASRPDDHIFVTGHDTTHSGAQSRDPARTITMLDYELNPVLDNNAATDDMSLSVSTSLGRESSIECLLRAAASDEGQTQSRKSAPLNITLCHEGFEIQ